MSNPSQTPYPANSELSVAGQSSTNDISPPSERVPAQFEAFVKQLQRSSVFWEEGRGQQLLAMQNVASFTSKWEEEKRVLDERVSSIYDVVKDLAETLLVRDLGTAALYNQLSEAQSRMLAEHMGGMESRLQAVLERQERNLEAKWEAHGTRLDARLDALDIAVGDLKSILDGRNHVMMHDVHGLIEAHGRKMDERLDSLVTLVKDTQEHITKSVKWVHENTSNGLQVIYERMKATESSVLSSCESGRRQTIGSTTWVLDGMNVKLAEVLGGKGQIVARLDALETNLNHRHDNILARMDASTSAVTDAFLKTKECDTSTTTSTQQMVVGEANAELPIILERFAALDRSVWDAREAGQKQTFASAAWVFEQFSEKLTAVTGGEKNIGKSLDDFGAVIKNGHDHIATQIDASTAKLMEAVSAVTEQVSKNWLGKAVAGYSRVEKLRNDIKELAGAILERDTGLVSNLNMLSDGQHERFADCVNGLERTLRSESEKHAQTATNTLQQYLEPRFCRIDEGMSGLERIVEKSGSALSGVLTEGFNRVEAPTTISSALCEVEKGLSARLDQSDTNCSRMEAAMTSMVAERFNRTEFVNARLSEAITSTRNEIHSDRDALAEQQEIICNVLSQLLEEVREMKCVSTESLNQYESEKATVPDPSPGHLSPGKTSDSDLESSRQDSPNGRKSSATGMELGEEDASQLVVGTSSKPDGQVRTPSVEGLPSPPPAVDTNQVAIPPDTKVKTDPGSLVKSEPSVPATSSTNPSSKSQAPNASSSDPIANKPSQWTQPTLYNLYLDPERSVSPCTSLESDDEEELENRPTGLSTASTSQPKVTGDPRLRPRRQPMISQVTGLASTRKRPLRNKPTEQQNDVHKRKKRRVAPTPAAVSGKQPTEKSKSKSKPNRRRAKAVITKPKGSRPAVGIWPATVCIDEVNHDRNLIQCDKCDYYYHYRCVGIKENDPRCNEGEQYLCPFCTCNQNPRAHHKSSDSESMKERCNRPDCDAKEPTFVIEALVGRAFLDAAGKGSTVQHIPYEWLVKWYKYDMEDALWIPHSELQPHDSLVQEFNSSAEAEGLEWRATDKTILLQAARSCEWVIQNLDEDIEMS